MSELKPGFYWARPYLSTTPRLRDDPIVMELQEYGQWFSPGREAAEWTAPEVLSERLEPPS